MKFGKVWGQTKPLLVTPMIELHVIDIAPRAHCSKHKHQHKWNAFYCVTGSVEIHVVKKGYDLTDVSILGPGDLTTVPPGEFHWFETRGDPAQVIEIYYPEALADDIIRETIGGLHGVEDTSA